MPAERRFGAMLYPVIKRLRRPLRQATRRRKGREEGSRPPVIVEGRAMADVRYLGCGRMGGLSWAGRLGDRPVKIYEAQGAGPAEYVERVCGHPELGRHFPQVLARSGRYLVVEWVQGTVLTARHFEHDRRLLARLAELQVALHAHTLAADVQPFDYLDYVRRRLLRYLGPFEPAPAMARLLDCVERERPQEGVRVAHEDVTPRNLVIEERTGALKLIDNEQLGQNGYWLYDLFNTDSNIAPASGLAMAYIACYQEAGGDVTGLVRNRRFYLALWALRRVGSRLQKGQVAEAMEVAERCDPASQVRHPLLEAAEAALR